MFCKSVDKVVVTLAHNGHDTVAEISSTQSDISEVEAPSTAADSLQGRIIATDGEASGEQTGKTEAL